MLKLSDVHTYRGESYVLQGVSLPVAPGEVVCLLGRNGAGKTTTIRTIMGFEPPRRGEITLRGRRIDGLPPARVAQLGIGLVMQGRRVFDDLTVRENLTVAARRRGRGWDLERAYASFPVLRQHAGQKAGTLSGGQQQMLAIARALLTDPELVLMDEPSEGLAPRTLGEVAEIIRRLKAEGLSMLIVEQNLPLALSVADRLYVMSKGRIVFEGSREALLSDHETMARHLGV